MCGKIKEESLQAVIPILDPQMHPFNYTPKQNKSSYQVPPLPLPPILSLPIPRSSCAVHGLLSSWPQPFQHPPTLTSSEKPFPSTSSTARLDSAHRMDTYYLVAYRWPQTCFLWEEGLFQKRTCLLAGHFDFDSGIYPIGEAPIARRCGYRWVRVSTVYIRGTRPPQDLSHRYSYVSYKKFLFPSKAIIRVEILQSRPQISHTGVLAL
jgi:hypothetical protein